MSRYRFELASADDDAALRDFLRRSVMPGPLRLSFRREPEYFAPGATFGPFNQTIVCRDDAVGEIVGMGARSVRTVHVDGALTPIGYLSALRSTEQVRNGLLLARGYRFLRELHGDGRAPVYLTTIAEGNDTALSVLTSGRNPLPSYRPAGRYRTFALATNRRPRRGGAAAGSVDHPADAAAVAAFLAGHGKSRQFFPAYERDDFEGPNATFAGMARDDVFVSRDRSGPIRGTLALWDQRPFRQTVIAGYEGSLERLRPLLNAASIVHRRGRLPAPGEQLEYGYAAIPAVEDDNPEVFEALLGAVLARASDRGLPTVLFGCHETDPLARLVERRAFLTYTTQVFVVAWSGGPEGGEPPYDTAIPLYLELGCL